MRFTIAAYWVKLPCVFLGGACVPVAKEEIRPTLANGNAGVRPNWSFVQSQLAATIPHAKAAEALNMLLPATNAGSDSTVRRHALATGNYLDQRGLIANQAPSSKSRIHSRLPSAWTADISGTAIRVRNNPSK